MYSTKEWRMCTNLDTGTLFVKEPRGWINSFAFLESLLTQQVLLEYLGIYTLEADHVAAMKP